jgi:hypothetical protein
MLDSEREFYRFEVITFFSDSLPLPPANAPPSPDRLNTTASTFTLSWLESLIDDIWLGGYYLVIADLHQISR